MTQSIDYTIEAHDVRVRPGLSIDIDGAEVSIDGLYVTAYYYERSDRYGDDLVLLSDGVECQIDLDANALRLHVGYGEMTVSFPDAFVADLTDALERHNIPERFD